jgi:thiamine-phosphate pyrophosphorylase
MIDKLHFISQETAELSHLQSIENACRAGVTWVQLRIKNKAINDIIAIAKEAKLVCDSFDSKLIINDHPIVAREVQSYGLHLGKDDMPVNEARKIVGDKMIIGGTANTIDDIAMHVSHGANYIGCGPYRFTKTKLKLSPILGLEGYKDILRQMISLDISIPVIAIGGIQTGDISAIMQAGLYGIACSSLIAFADDPKEEVKKINACLKGEPTLC